MKNKKKTMLHLSYALFAIKSLGKKEKVLVPMAHIHGSPAQIKKHINAMVNGIVKVYSKL